jgi:hypothetical protein
MKRFTETLAHPWPALLLLALGVMASAVLFSGVEGADAQSSGITPVFCTIPGQLISGEQDDFNCSYTDLSGSFSTVPAGQYLHVTDVLITPRTFPASEARYAVFISQRNSGGTFRQSRAFSSDTPDMTKMSSTMPLLIAGPGDFFSAESLDFVGEVEPNLDVDIIGYLASEPKVYLPLMSRD